MMIFAIATSKASGQTDQTKAIIVYPMELIWNTTQSYLILNAKARKCTKQTMYMIAIKYYNNKILFNICT